MGEGGDLRARWRRGEATFGGWCSIADPFVTEIMARSGFDWVCLDMQHGLIDMTALVPMLLATDAAGIPAFVRVPQALDSWTPRALDLGAAGVIVPMVESAAQAREIVASARYAPLGSRSWGPTRALIRLPAYTAASANSSTLLVLMVETARGIENVEEIMAVPGVDAVFIGPADLAVSQGFPPQGSAAATSELIARVIRGGRTCGVPTGVFCQDEGEVGAYVAEGVSMIALMSDARLLKASAASLLSRAHGITQIPSASPEGLGR